MIVLKDVRETVMIVLKDVRETVMIVLKMSEKVS